MHKQVKNLVNGAMLASLIALATMALRIPLPMEKGYGNLGDAVILLCGVLPPAWAAAAAAAGSALSDVLLGYAVYAPATAVIKGLMGYLAGRWIAKKARLPQKLIGMIAAEGWMVAGYFLFEWAVYGVSPAVAGLAPNLFQGAVCLALAALMQKPMAALEKMIKTR